VIIVIEGADGSGKSTQAKLLAERISYQLQRFPDRATRIGRLIDMHLKSEIALAATSPGEPPLVLADGLADALMFQCLQLANRMEHGDFLRNASRSSMINVVCDRYSQSGIVYGTADGLSLDHMLEIHSLVPEANLNILIDVPADVSRRRLEARGNADRYESKRGDFLTRVSDGYRNLWARKRVSGLGGSWSWIDGTMPVEAVHEEVMKVVKQSLGGRVAVE